MGTAIMLTVYAEENAFAELVDETKSILSYAESLTSDGAVAQFNAAEYGEKVEIDETVYSILKAVKTEPVFDGFNPLAAPLVDLWGFSPRFKTGGESKPYDREKTENGGYPLPDKEYIDAFLTLSDIDGITLIEEESKYFCVKNIPSVTVRGIPYCAQMDLGGCLKGYCADKIAESCARLGIEYGYVSFGTSSISLLYNKSGEWTVALSDPDDREKSYYKFKLSSGNVSTSADYENYYVTDGVRYCHIIGKDGYPVHNARSVSVVGKSAMYCDMLSTALMTVNKEDLPERIAALKEKDYRVICRYGEETILTEN